MARQPPGFLKERTDPRVTADTEVDAAEVKDTVDAAAADAAAWRKDSTT